MPCGKSRARLLPCPPGQRTMSSKNSSSATSCEVWVWVTFDESGG
jgi:hypothetical protein